MTDRLFQHGDLVHIPDLGPSMAHFPTGCDAIVVGSYADRFGGSDHENLTLFLRDHGEVSWYPASRLSLVERGRTDLREQWAEERERDRQVHSDLDWIFAHGNEILSPSGSCPGASVAALAACCGIDDLWGPHGEGYNYLMTVRGVLANAAPYLRRGDKAGWLAKCARLEGWL